MLIYAHMLYHEYLFGSLTRHPENFRSTSKVALKREATGWDFSVSQMQFCT